MRTRRGPAPGSFLAGLRRGARQLLRRPGMTAVAVVTLALGIGANTAVFSVVSGVLLTPLPYPEADRLVRVFDDHPPQFPLFPLSPAAFLDYRERSDAFDGLALYMRSDLQLGMAERPERLVGMRVSAGFFETLGVSPALGRGFTRDEELAGWNRVAVLGHGLWERVYAADPGILGATVELSGIPFTVVGIAPPGLRPPGGDFRAVSHDESVDVWYPLILGPDEQPRGSHYVNGVARLREGLSLTDAERGLKAVAAEIAVETGRGDRPCTVELLGLKNEIVGHARPMLLVLLGASGLILLIACVNLASLLLARGADRRGDISVRLALGAGRGHLLRQILAEGAVLAGIGAAAAMALAWIGVEQLVRLAPAELPRLYAVGVDGGVLAVGLAVTGVTVLLASLAPMAQTRGLDVAAMLRTHGSRGGRRTGRPRRMLVAAQASLAVVLLVGAGLLLRTFVELRSVEPGFRAEGVLTALLTLPSALYPGGAQRGPFTAALLSRLEALPGVRAAGVTNALPWTGWDENTGFEIDGWTAPEGLTLTTRYHWASPGYFEAVGIPLTAGRHLTHADDWQSTRVVVINESMARRYWREQRGAGEPLGSRIDFFYDTWTVVGIVGDVKDSPGDPEAHPAVFIPVLQAPIRTMTVAVRTEGEPTALTAAVRREVATLDASLPVTDTRPLGDIVRAASADARFTALLVGLFAALALVLAAVGLFGLMSYLVGQRRWEIAVRMALGARAGSVLGRVMAEGVTLVAGGAALGLAASFFVTPALSSVLFGVEPFDPCTLVAVASGMLLVAAVACLVPGRRAAGVDPMQAMRPE